MRKIRYIFALLALVVVSCVREDISEPYIGDEVVDVLLDFTHEDFEVTDITTKATLNLIPESRVQNMFIYIFVGEKRVYAHYFDRNNMFDTLAQIQAVDMNCWTVTNRSSNEPDDTETSGYIKLKSPTLDGGTIYVIANIDADMVNISPEKLNTVRSVSDLEDLTASLNQEITSRNGYFPMSFKTGISISGSGVILEDAIELERLDAKVKVNIRVATDNELSSEDSGVTTTQTLKEFVPESWRVVNVPKGAYVFGNDYDYDDAGYFNTEPVVFETKEDITFTFEDADGNEHTVSSPVNGFSFYMVENRETAKTSVSGDYHQRDKRVKDVYGQYVKSGDMWVNAPEYGTYLEIKGEVVMIVDVSSEAKQQQLSAAVTYYVHLGDLLESMDNYSIERNTIYNYTITIKGVSEIETEVTTSNMTGVGPQDPGFEENETGAAGQVYIAKESIYTFDAHYGQRVFCFDAAYIDVDNVTWYVKTPFGKEGVPEKIGDTEVPAGMDYKWVHFLLNNVEDGVYSQKNQPWPGDPDDGEYYTYYKDNYGVDESDLMDVLEFTQFIKAEKRKYDNGLASAFLKEFDSDWLAWYNTNNGTSYTEDEAKTMTDDSYPWWRYRMYLTVFVDEFYYEEDPITGDAREGLWKEFVNQPNRLMHLLCDNQKSFDKESSATGSVVTIRQRSIQTPYNITKSDLMTAWGGEVVDETADSHLLFFSNLSSDTNFTDFGNDSRVNGRYNTAKLWQLESGSKWDTYLDYQRVNDYTYTMGSGFEQNIYFLRNESDADYATMRYAPLLRNRDNNGNGYINEDEVRWYIASINQLYEFYFGQLGMSSDAHLYPIELSMAPYEQLGDGSHYNDELKWVLHIVSSTSDDYYPVVLWGEEGFSVSKYTDEYDKDGPYIIKCIRDLGMDGDNISEDNIPSPMITVEETTGTPDASSVYRFDLTNINSKSMRFYTTKELEPSNEYDEISRLYYGFETGEMVTPSPSGYNALKTTLESGASSGCPDGYRVPNVREGAVMSLYIDNDAWWPSKTLVGTYYSLGLHGSKLYGDNVYSWYFEKNVCTVGRDHDSHAKIRCVKDSHPDTW